MENNELSRLGGTEFEKEVLSYMDDAEAHFDSVLAKDEWETPKDQASAFATRLQRRLEARYPHFEWRVPTDLDGYWVIWQTRPLGHAEAPAIGDNQSC
jgi:hypothetical protein